MVERRHFSVFPADWRDSAGKSSGAKEATVCWKYQPWFSKATKPSQLQPDGRRCSVHAVCVTLPFPFTCTNPYKSSSPPTPDPRPRLSLLRSAPVVPSSSCQREAHRALLSHHLPLSVPDPPETNTSCGFGNLPPTPHPPLLCTCAIHSALLTPTTFLLKLFNKKLHAVFVPTPSLSVCES